MSKDTTSIDEQIDELKAECDIDAYGTMGENAHWVFNQFKILVAKAVVEARKEEWQTILNAKITHGGSPAPFNPYGLPISTPATEEMTKLLHQYAEHRIAELQQLNTDKE